MGEKADGIEQAKPVKQKQGAQKTHIGDLGQGPVVEVTLAMAVLKRKNRELRQHAVGGGLLASPRADLLGEWRDLLSGLQPVDLLRSMIRAALFLAAICAWTRWRSGDSTRSDPRSDHGLTLFPSNLLVEGLMVLSHLS